MSRYFTRPLHFFGQAALWFSSMAALAVACMLAFKYGWLFPLGVTYRASFVQTPLPELAVSLFVGAVVSLFCGILGEILVRVLHESQGLKPYAVKRVAHSESKL